MLIATGSELDENYQAEAIRLFVYNTYGYEHSNITEWPERLAQEFLTVASEYLAHKKDPKGE